MMRLPRPALALGLSLLAHAAAAGLVAGTAIVQGLARAPQVDLRLVAIEVRQVDDLPLGAPPASKGEGARAGEAPKPRPRRRARAAAGGVAVAAGSADAGTSSLSPAADAGAADAGLNGTGADAGGTGSSGADAGPRRRDVRPVGPEGSRLTALLRIDRLRSGPEAAETIAAVDALLRLLPDRRRLIDGTGLDLYRDFEAILIATPNPMDDAVTFLAARHRLPEPALKAALERGAAAAGRPLRWRTDTDRPVGVRARREGRVERDDRLFVLPAPGLAVMAPPAYAALLAPAPPEGRDGGPPPAEAAAAAAARWKALAARIDAEDGAMPEEAVLMLTGTQLLRGSALPRGGDPSAPAAAGGLPLPSSFTLLAGTTPAPFLELAAELPSAAAARAWEERFPTLQKELAGNPLLLLAGFTSLVQRIEIAREDATVTLRLTPTGAELRRLLLTAANLAQAGAR